MTEPLAIRVRNALDGIINPATGRSIVADGAVKGLSAGEDGVVRFTLEFAGGNRRACEAALEAAKTAVSAIDGVVSVSAIATAHAEKPAPTAQQVQSAHANPLGLQNQKKRQIEEAAETLTGVKRIIAVASGKGGVGKSTLSANLAVAMGRLGIRVGLLDADIYGPSLPTLLGLHRRAEMRDGKLIPFEAHGIRAMSIGVIVDPDQALAWRGPMVMGALGQLMRDVEWGELDVMLVDTPPGTGDAHLSLIQSKRLSGAVIVSTPQELALADVRRGVALFRKTGTPIIGVIENMAWLEGPGGAKQHLFGEGGAQKAARDLGAPFLGAVPIYPDLRMASDSGTPLAATDHPCADIFMALAEKIAAFTASI